METESYGITNQTDISNETDAYLEELKINGFAIVHNVLPEEELKTAAEKLDAVYQHQVKEFSATELETIHESFLARLPMAYDDYFVKIAAHKKVISTIRKVLGNYFVLQLQNGIINMPRLNHHQSSWHRDLPYQDFVISKPLAISVLLCLDDFNETTGGTLVLPFSHHLDAMPSKGYVKKHTHQIIAPKGSAIFFDSMVFHKAGYNASKQIRRGINHVYTAAFIKQQINIPASLNGKFNDDPFLKMLLGYETTVPKDVVEWRRGRLARQ